MATFGGRKRRGLDGQPAPFQTRAFQWPLNLGIQTPFWQAGGPSGFENGTAGACQPWPYVTAFKNFISGFPYGVASTLVTNSGRGLNLGSSSPLFRPVGMMKPQTYTSAYF